MLTDKSAFNEDVYKNGFSSVLIRCKSLEGADRFADDYSKKVDYLKITTKQQKVDILSY